MSLKARKLYTESKQDHFRRLDQLNLMLGFAEGSEREDFCFGKREAAFWWVEDFGF
jgi:hypothetical protein